MTILSGLELSAEGQAGFLMVILAPLRPVAFALRPATSTYDDDLAPVLLLPMTSKATSPTQPTAPTMTMSSMLSGGPVVVPVLPG